MKRYELTQTQWDRIAPLLPGNRLEKLAKKRAARLDRQNKPYDFAELLRLEPDPG